MDKMNLFGKDNEKKESVLMEANGTEVANTPKAPMSARRSPTAWSSNFGHKIPGVSKSSTVTFLNVVDLSMACSISEDL